MTGHGPTLGIARVQSSRDGGSPASPRFAFVDRAFLIFVALIPWIPRPTVQGIGAALAPIALAAFIYLFALWLLRERKGPKYGRPVLVRLGLLCVASMLPYCTAFLVTPTANELVRLLARFGMLAGALCFAYWMMVRGIAADTVGRYFYVGYLGVAALIVTAGVTGVTIFQEPAIARNYGIVLPFEKAVGIPRSYGELGIIICMAWAYLLVAWRGLPRWAAIAGMGLIPLSAVISQSRTVYVGFIAVTLCYLVLRRRRLILVTVGVPFLCLMGSVFLSVAFPALEDQPVARGIVGQGYVYNNVADRITLVQTAREMVRTQPAKALIGYSREEWNERSDDALGDPLALHNHFMALVIFLGVTGGAITIGGLYLAPLLAVGRFRWNFGGGMFTYLSFVGAMICLSFYEGYFSLAFMIVLGILWAGACRSATMASKPQQSAVSQ